MKNQKKLNEVSKPLHLSTNPEILVKIALLVSQLRWLESRQLKKLNKKNKEKTSVKYIALPASLPSGLNKYCEVKQTFTASDMLSDNCDVSGTVSLL